MEHCQIVCLSVWPEVDIFTEPCLVSGRLSIYLRFVNSVFARVAAISTLLPRADFPTSISISPLLIGICMDQTIRHIQHAVKGPANASRCPE